MSMTWNEWSELWLARRGEIGKAKSTQMMDASAIRKVMEHADGHKDIASIGPLDIDKVLRGLRKSGLQDSTVYGYMIRCKAMFGDAERLGIISSNPAKGIRLTCPYADIEAPELTDDQIVRIGRAIDNSGVATAWMLAGFAGLRRAECFGIDRTAIKDDRIVVPKIKTKRRSVRLEPELREWAFPAKGLVCGGMDPRRCYAEIEIGFAKCGILPFRKPLQMLRRLREQRWNMLYPPSVVCIWMGHSPQVAARHYNTVPEGCYGVEESE